MWWLICLALGLGIVAGWFLRSTLQGNDRRVLDELYTRKLKLAEADREKAVKQLNANLVEMQGFAQRFEDRDQEIAALRADVDGQAERREAALRELEEARASVERLASRIG